jgi:hypothetical protein
MENIIGMEQMTANGLYVFIYKTSVETGIDREFIANTLNHFLGVRNWTIDLSDEDKILRVESKDNDANRVIGLLNAYGFICMQMHY